MEFRGLILRNRSYRRFDQSVAVAMGDLVECVDLARLSGSGGNVQPLKYSLSTDPAMNARIFPHLRWAGYIPDWPGPADDGR